MVDHRVNAPPVPGLGRRITRLFGLGDEGLRFWETLSIFGFAMGLACIAVYAAAGPRPVLALGILALTGTAAWLSGGVLGFLFGVPRLRAAGGQPLQGSPAGAFTPNTNLEQISDWLTKAIVGATLVQLGPLARGLSELAVAIGSGIGTPGAAVAAGAVMTLYAAGGFMWGYLWCSLRIFGEMSALVDREKAVAQREAAPPASAGP